MSAEAPVIELERLHHRYAGPPPLDALTDVQLCVNAGDYLAIVGPSGSGKSTLLNILGLLDRPTAGAYRLNGIDTGELGDAERAFLRGSEIGFVFQAFHLLEHRTAVDNVALATLYQATPKRERERRAAEMLSRVGLSHRLDAVPSQLSGGERQRVAIARALTATPSLLLCDEPTGNLDSSNALAVMALMDELVSDGITVLVITHDPVVSARAARCVRIQDGRLEMAG